MSDVEAIVREVVALAATDRDIGMQAAHMWIAGNMGQGYDMSARALDAQTWDW